MADESPRPEEADLELLTPEISTGDESLPLDRCLAIYRIMVRARAMEERMIKMSKSGEGYFWIGGPGEEAFNAALGFLVKKGPGPAFDYLHLHYRSSATPLPPRAAAAPTPDAAQQPAGSKPGPQAARAAVRA